MASWPRSITATNLPESPAAGSLIEPAAVASTETGSRLPLTLEVENVNATCGELTDRGVELLNGPINREWGIRMASFRDPGAHIWEIAEPLG